jgi:hypothetical protein
MTPTADVAARALALIPELAAAEVRLLEAQHALAAARLLLADAEADALVSNQVQGKNAEPRAAHLRVLVSDALNRVFAAEHEHRAAASASYLLEHESDALRAILVSTGGAA